MLICPSMMCANFNNLQEEVKELDNAGIDIFHIDIMDGHFVPNFGMGLQDIEVIKKATDKLIDVHLMISNPGEYIELFAGFGVDIIYIHPESDKHPTRTLDKIKEKGKKAGIAINPGTSIHQIEELLSLVDYVLVMTVNPGFSGQKYLDYVDEKIMKLVNLKINNTFEIIVDGAVSPTVMKKLSGIGVDGFVLGTSALFGKEQKYRELINNFKY
ncbi:ribulose-phosphate 3-epimerase [Oceanobacillus oncorhynchi subsp. incaldanensis]|nr:ribulose-phosphate 3-epimerase [Oceanobacillus oncorhynchi subsp. incaldanensis]